MIGEYTCPFYHNSDEVCEKTCMKPEGCSYHWKAKRRIPCTIDAAQIIWAIIK